MGPQSGKERSETRTLVLVLVGIFLATILVAIGATSFLWNHLLEILIPSVVVFLGATLVLYVANWRPGTTLKDELEHGATGHTGRAGKRGGSEGDTKTPPYNLIVAIVCVVAATAAYVLVMWLFKGLIKVPGDVAIVAGALGVLFTFVGTLAGAYFGINSTQDTTDKADRRSREEAERMERAYRDPPRT